jgi:hypothetical protein
VGRDDGPMSAALPGKAQLLSEVGFCEAVLLWGTGQSEFHVGAT